jgi:hypothetical protein
MSTQTLPITMISGAWQDVASPPNVIGASKQTGVHSILDWQHRAPAMSVDLASVRKLERGRTVDEAERESFRINSRS